MIIQTTATIILDITKPAEKKLEDRLKEQGQLKYSYLGNDMCSFELNNEIEKDASDYVKDPGDKYSEIVTDKRHGRFIDGANFDDYVSLKRVIDILSSSKI